MRGLAGRCAKEGGRCRAPANYSMQARFTAPPWRSDSGSRARACFLRVCGVGHDAVASGLLRRVERFVGAAQQLLGFLGVIGEDSNPEGNGDGPERSIAIAKLEL